MKLVKATDDRCHEAHITSMLIQFDSQEIQDMEPDPSALADKFESGEEKLEQMIRRTKFAAVLLHAAIAICETCALDVPLDQKVCPNKSTINFIVNDLL